MADEPAVSHEEKSPPESFAPPAPQPSTLRKVFVGKDGIRAGWSLLIFIVILVAVAFAARSIAHAIHPVPAKRPPATQQELEPGAMLLTEGIPALIILLVTWVMSKIERRPNSVYGLGSSRKLKHFIAGLVWGGICLSLLVFTLAQTGFLAIDRRVLFGSDALRYGALWLLVFLLVGVFEEYLMRGYVQFTLTRGFAGIYTWLFKTRHSKALGFWTAGVLMSFLFGFAHGSNPGESPIGLLSAGLAGLVFCLSLWRTGSLWWAIGFHATWDWSQSFLYGVADSGLLAQHHLLETHPIGKPLLSGGTTGPEGSIFILGVFAVICLIIFATLRPASKETA